MLGIFDSGLGGLLFTQYVNRLYPDIDTLYLGDQLRVPYGGRSKEAVIQFTQQCVLALFERGATMVIIACNTASAEALRYLQQAYPEKKILGILIPGVEAAIESTKNDVIGVVATKATVSIGAYTREIHKRDPGRKVVEVSAPLLVPFIEEGEGKSPSCRRFVKKYIRSLKNAHIKTLILGCTHYPLIRSVFDSVLSKHVSVVDPSLEAAERLQDYFLRHPEISERITREGRRIFYTTDSPAHLQTQAKMFYSGAIDIQQISF